MRKLLVYLTVLSLCLTGASALGAEESYVPGVYTASAQGFGGVVSVEIEADADKILSVNVFGESETPSIGGQALPLMAEAILSAQSAEVDGVAGATFTSDGVKEAARSVIAQAKGADNAELMMKAGVYTAEAYGYSKGEPLNITVTVDQTHILSIDVDADNAETEPVFNAALAIVPEIIEKQSLAVDGVTGATFTSGAIIKGATDAVKEAIKQADSDESAVQALLVKPAKSGETVGIDADVVVVGMGASGLSTMTRLVEKLSENNSDVNVIALEKNGYYGGCSLMASDFFCVNPTRHQEKYNGGENFMDADVMREIWMNYTDSDAKSELIDLMVDNSGETLDWLEFDHDYQFVEKAIEGFDGDAHYAGKIQFLPNDNGAVNKPAMYANFTNLVNEYTEKGGKYMLETEAYELMLDGQTGEVSGVKARNLRNGTEYVINAKKVVLATGGFLDNVEMTTKYLKDEYYPLSGAWNSLDVGSCDGKMIASAIENGAGTYNIGITPMVHLTSSYAEVTGFDTHVVEDKIGTITDRTAMWSENDVPKYMVISPYSVAVNRFGQRFATEERIGFLDSWKAGPYFYSLWSQAQIDEIRESGFDRDSLVGPSVAWLGYRDAVPADYVTTREHLMALPMPDRYITCMPDHTPIAAVDDIMQAGIDAGFIFKADTLEQLAETLGIDAETLKNTVDTFNGYCENGEDPDFKKSEKYLRPLDVEGPYYAVKGSSYAYATCGALDVNENLEVLAADGETVIPGLYAVGNDCSGVLYTEKKAYVTYGGVGQGWAYTSGYVCGQILSDLISK